LTGHLTQDQIEEYGRRSLPAAVLLSVSDHLGACEPCRRLVERALDADAAFFALRSEVFGEAAEIPSRAAIWAHPTVEETAEYVDGTLAGEEKQVVTDHLASCERCTLAVDDLRAFRNQVAPALEREYHPATVPNPAASRWHRLAAFPPSPWLRSPVLAFGSALAVLLLAVTGLLIWQKLQQEETKQEAAVTPPSPTAPTPAPAVTPTPSSPPAPVIAELNDGEGRVVLDREGKLSGADHLPPDYQRMVKEALTRQRLEKSPLLAGLARPGSPLMSSGKQGRGFSVVEPVGKVLLADRPTFRWTPLDGATGYVVEVYDEKFNLAAASPQLTDNSWAVPQPLKRGGTYAWQVKAVKDGQEFRSPRPPEPQAKFRILDQARANELAQARQAYPSSHLALGLLYGQAGLVEEAEQEFRALEKANPDSALVRRLLDQAQALWR
jgi:anti-sigma factor RsiW